MKHALKAPPGGKQNVERFLFSVRNSALMKRRGADTVKIREVKIKNFKQQRQQRDNVTTIAAALSTSPSQDKQL